MKSELFIICSLALLVIFPGTFARPNFDKAKDLLLANYDLKPDEDDVMAAAAFACMLLHSDLAGVKYIAVAGAYGDQGGSYITTATPGLYNTLFGSNWTDAHRNRNGSLNKVSDLVKTTLNTGGKVFIAEAGQSNFSYDMLQMVKNAGVSASVIKSRVIAVQHSDWNEEQTTGSELNWMKNNTDYNKIADGNSGNNETPRYKDKDRKWLVNAQASGNPNPRARKFWSDADDVLDAWNPSWNNQTIEDGGVDYSDCVEMWWIFEIGNKADNVSKFWDRYVTNENNTHINSLITNPDFSKGLSAYYTNSLKTVSVCFTLQSSGNITLNIYNIKGVHVKTLTDRYMGPGTYSMQIDTHSKGKILGDGVYLIKLNTDDNSVSEKVTIMQ